MEVDLGYVCLRSLSVRPSVFFLVCVSGSGIILFRLLENLIRLEVRTLGNKSNRLLKVLTQVL